MKTTPLETGHGERRASLIGYLRGLKLGEAHGAQTGIEMKAQLACRAGLTIAQACELFGVAEQKFDLKARFVITIAGLSRQRHVRAKEQGIAPSRPVAHQHQAQITLAVTMLHHLMIEFDIFIARLDRRQAREIAAGDFPIVDFGPPRAALTWPALKMTQIGITT